MQTGACHASVLSRLLPLFHGLMKALFMFVLTNSTETYTADISRVSEQVEGCYIWLFDSFSCIKESLWLSSCNIFNVLHYNHKVLEINTVIRWRIHEIYQKWQSRLLQMISISHKCCSFYSTKSPEKKKCIMVSTKILSSTSDFNIDNKKCQIRKVM